MDLLSESQRDKLDLYRQKWAAARVSTNPANRSEAEAGVAAAYAAAGLSPPDEIRWCDSPLEMENDRRRAWLSLAPGALVRHEVVDNIFRRVNTWILDTVPEALRRRVERSVSSHSRYGEATMALAEAIGRHASRAGWGLRDQLRLLVRPKAGKYVSFQTSRWLPAEAADGLATIAFLRDECGYTIDTDPAQGLLQIAMSCGGMLPHSRICWLSERPTIMSSDIHGRLHSAQGPAVRYPDGWSHYAWKGIHLEPWHIEESETIDARVIDREFDPVLRRCMIEIMTPARYVATGGAKRIAVDKVGTLWRKEWRGFDVWMAVEVVNGTPEPDGTLKHYFLQVPPQMSTPTEAVAWTYGMPADRYAHLSHRT